MCVDIDMIQDNVNIKKISVCVCVDIDMVQDNVNIKKISVECVCVCVCVCGHRYDPRQCQHQKDFS